MTWGLHTPLTVPRAAGGISAYVIQLRMPVKQSETKGSQYLYYAYIHSHGQSQWKPLPNALIWLIPPIVVSGLRKL